jgi:hypothetical protein
MKKRTKPFPNLFLAVCTLLFFSAKPSVAQEKAGDFVFTGGAAVSFTQFGTQPFLGGSNLYYTGSNNGSITPWSYPAYVLNAERGMSDRISLGVCMSWQSLGYKFNNIAYPSQNYNYQYGNPPSPLVSWTDTYNRYNVSMRGLYHFVNSNEWDLYLGVRIGYTWWDRQSTNPDPAYNYSYRDEYSSIFITPISIQSVLGLRYFFSDNFGINGELGIGAPYAGMLGISVRFNK